RITNRVLASEASKPVLFTKIVHESECDGNHHQPKDRIAVSVGQLGHVMKVHPVYTGEKSQGHKDRRDNRQHLHHAVHLKRYLAEMQLLETVEHLPLDLHLLDDLQHVIVQIAQIGPGLLMNKKTVSAAQATDQFSHGHQAFTQIEVLVFHVVDLLPKRGRFTTVDLVLEKLCLLLQLVQDVVITIHRMVDQYVCQVVCRAAPYLAPPLLQARFYIRENICRALLTGKDKAVVEIHRNLFLRNFPGLLRPVQGGKYHNDSRWILIKFGPLVCISDVLQRQRVDVVTLSEDLEQLRVVNPAQVNPHDLARSRPGEFQSLVIAGVD